MHFNLILESIWDLVRASNNYIAQREPWKLAKTDPQELKQVITDLWNAVRITAVLLYPFMPGSAEKMWRQLGLKSLTEEVKLTRAEKGPEGIDVHPEIFEWHWRPDYEIRVLRGEQLFPRIETKEEKPKKTDQKKRRAGVAEEGVKELISIQDFAKVELKVGVVKFAERVEKSEKLLKLLVDTGEERQLVAGIGKMYSPEDLVGKKIVVVANLQPAKLMGVESRGMLLAATDDEGKLSILTLDRDVNEGARVK